MKKQQATGSGMKKLALSVTFFASTLAPLTTYGADGVLKGRVTDKADGEGVVGAAVSVTGTNIATATDIDGNFVLRNVPAKQQKVTVSSVGYAPTTQVITLADGQTATLNFALGQTTIMASEVVVGAALYKQDRLEVPVTANVVSKEKIKEKSNTSLASAIEDVPGIVVSRSGGTSASGVEIRGSNAFQGGGIGTRVQAIYDGFPINAPESGEIVWQTANMNAADKVEVLKGAAATLYGSGAMGGVVNVTSHLPDKEEIVAGASYGFYDKVPSSDNSAYRKNFTPSLWNSYVGYGNKEGKWRYNILYSHSADQGYRYNTDYHLDDLKFKARYDIDATQYLQLTSLYNHTIGGYTSTWPYTPAFTLWPTWTATYPSRAYDMNGTVPGKDNITMRSNALVGLNYVKLFGDSISLDTKVYYTHNGNRNEYPAYIAPGSIFTRVPFKETFSDRVGVGTKLDWRLNDQHRLLAGVDANVTKVTSSQLFNVSLFDYSFHDQQEKNFSLFLQDEWKITNKLTALGSIRYDWSGINIDKLGTTAINHPTVDAISPRFALNYKAQDDMSFRASWGKSFRAPSMFERFIRDAGPFATVNVNPDLNKETMTAWEVGVFKQLGSRASVDIAGFVNDYKDLIESVWTSTDGITHLPIYQYQNISKARIWGIETNLNVRPVDEVTVNVAYTYMHAKNNSIDSYPALTQTVVKDNPDPSWLPYRPEHSASASVTWKATKSFSLNANGRYIGKYKNTNMFNNAAGTNYPGNYVVFNLGTKYQINKNMSASLTCNNVFNTQYEEIAWFRAPNRSFVAGIDLSY
jgi:iron complex outermembrane receptor protein